MSLLLDALKKAEEAKRRKLEADGASPTTVPLQLDVEPAAEPPIAAPETPSIEPAMDFPELSMAEPDEAPHVDANKSSGPATKPEESGLSLEPAPTIEFTSAHAYATNEVHVDPAPPILEFATPLPAVEQPVAAETSPETAAAVATEKPLEVTPNSTANKVASAAARLSGRSGKLPATMDLSEQIVQSVGHSPNEENVADSSTAQNGPKRDLAHSDQTASLSASSATSLSDRTLRAERPTPAKLSPEATRQLFNSKSSAKQPLSQSQRVLMLAGLVIVLAAMGGGWLWWQSQGGNFNNVPAQLASTPAAPATPPADVTPVPTGIPTRPSPQASPASTQNGSAPTLTQNDMSPKPPARLESEAPSRIAPQFKLQVQPRAGDRARVVEVPNSLAASDVHFVRTQGGPVVPTAVEQGYNAYQRGDYAAASKAYRQQLAQDPNSRDALLGLAAVAMQNKRTDEARTYYQRVLSLDPTDPTATAAMATFSAESDSAGAESRLLRAYQAQPTSETASALGSLFAHQQRWREAQDYYFRAYSTTPTEPDYAFNLAVSLDALGQRALAADYYSRALSMSANRSASFDRDAAQRRLSELKGS